MKKEVRAEASAPAGDDADPVVTDILTVATREFAEHGLAGARIERIVQHTRTSKRMIYYHFESKEGLFRAVLDRAFSAVRAVDLQFDPDAGTVEQALRTIARNAFEAFSSHPEFARLLAYENLSGARFIRDSDLVRTYNRRALQDMGQVIARGQREGSIRADVRPEDVYLNIVGLCYYHVAHQTGVQAGGLGAQRRSRAAAFDEQRRLAIEESCWRYVRA